jgi:threonine/homoserine/homoserine lactone efflux protein
VTIAAAARQGYTAQMTAEIILKIAIFTVAMLFSPGPNNVLLASSGARFGFWPSVPHLLGVALGFAVMLFAVALGLGEIFERSEVLREGLRWVGAAIMLWIGWKIATASRVENREAQKPWSFVQASGFQWINPKAWSICIAFAASFMTGTSPVIEALVCAVVVALIGIVSAAIWTGFGSALRRFLETDARLRAFNLAMGLLIALCAVFLIFD